MECMYGAYVGNMQITPNAYVAVANMWLNNKMDNDLYDDLLKCNRTGGASVGCSSLPDGYAVILENYENEHGNYGLFQAIADLINIQKRTDAILYEDGVLGILPGIPEDEDDRKYIVTKEQIRTWLAGYLKDVLVEPVTVDWFDVQL